MNLNTKISDLIRRRVRARLRQHSGEAVRGLVLGIEAGVVVVLVAVGRVVRWPLLSLESAEELDTLGREIGVPRGRTEP